MVPESDKVELRDLDAKVLREFENNAGVWRATSDYFYRNGQLLALKGLLTQLSKELQEQGYTQLIIRGVRYSGANPGRTATIVVTVPPTK